VIDPEVLPYVPQIDVGMRSVAEMRDLLARAAAKVRGCPVHRVVDRTVPGAEGSLPARLYYPTEASSHSLIVSLHGGGWSLGSLETHDAICRYLCRTSGFAVASVAYRLAPENKFPAAVLDAEAATSWILDHAEDLGCDPDRVVVVGESAGANLAAATAQRLKNRTGAKLGCQVLIFPLTDFRMRAPSLARNPTTPSLGTSMIAWCRDQYLRDTSDIADPNASPFLQPDLRGCAPAFVITAEMDPLCDDGEAYAQRLVEAGVLVTMRRYLGMPHGLVGLPIEIPKVREMYEDIAHVLRRHVG